MSKRALRADDLLTMRIPGDVRMSPDGETVWWTEKYVAGSPPKPRSRLVRCRVGGAPTPFTAGPGADRAPRVSPDGRRVAFLRSDPDKKGESSLCLIPSDGGEARLLLTAKGAFGAPAWSPDGAWICLAFRAADTLPEGEETPRSIRVDRLHYKEDGLGYLPTDRFSLYLVEVDADAPELLPFTDPDGDWDDLSPAWSPDGERIAFLSYRRGDRDVRPEESDLWVRPVAAGAALQCTKNPGPVVSFAWAPDGQWLAAIASPGPAAEFLGRNNAELFRVDAGGRAEERSLTAELDRCTMNLTIDDIWGLDAWGQPPVFAQGGREVWFPVSDQGTTRLSALELDSGTVRTVTDRAVVVMFDGDAEGRTVAALTSSHQDPGRIERIDVATGVVRTVARAMAAYSDGVTIRTPSELRIEPGEGRPELQAWLLMPDGPGPHPLLLDVHGGPMCQFGRGFFHELQWLAEEGFAVLYANPRGSQGYGRDFAAAIHRDWGAPPYADLMDVLEHTLAHPEHGPRIDPARLGVMGGSYGGYMTNWIIGHTDRFAAACTQRTVAYMDAMYWSDFGAGLGDFLGGRPWEEPDLYERLSPATYLKRVNTPLLILQGLDDHRTPRDQGERLFVTLRLMGKEARMVLFPGGDHNLSRNGSPVQRVERLEVIRDWFAERLLPG